MSDYKEVVHERLYVRVPGGDKLRKTAAGKLKYMLAAGWRETQRWQHPDHITVRLERSGHAPTMKILAQAPTPAAAREPRRPWRRLRRSWRWLRRSWRRWLRRPGPGGPPGAGGPGRGGPPAPAARARPARPRQRPRATP